MIVFLVVLVAVLGCANFFLVVNSLKLIQKLSIVAVSAVDKSQQPTPEKTSEQIYECKFNPQNEKIKEKGYIKKEKDDRELGSEFMFTFYFDEPFLLWENATGYPKFINSIELYKPEYETKSLVDYFNGYAGKRVELAGELTWGYAESRVIRVWATRIL